ncbi:hypothetical protein RRG08_016686 [Elysia crispata]|uniref:Uncharacterized protein n=1 Tax=Elysia crispata TaxID=231223 RepID=A0AAE1AL35_9GAST|nr:hypothetical protein RRG08_016686 [Elysia crispata]
MSRRKQLFGNDIGPSNRGHGCLDGTSPQHQSLADGNEHGSDVRSHEKSSVPTSRLIPRSPCQIILQKHGTWREIEIALTCPVWSRQTAKETVDNSGFEKDVAVVLMRHSALPTA